jgi:hypothetical protein
LRERIQQMSGSGDVSTSAGKLPWSRPPGQAVPFPHHLHPPSKLASLGIEEDDVVVFETRSGKIPELELLRWRE